MSGWTCGSRPNQALAAMVGCGLAVVALAAAPASAQPIGPEFRVNTFTTGNQESPSAAFQPNGFVAVWESDGQDGSGMGVFGRSAGGAEFPVNTFATGGQHDPDIASNGTGFIR